MGWFASRSALAAHLTVQQLLDTGPIWLVSLAVGAIVSSALRRRQPHALFGVQMAAWRGWIGVPLAALLGALSPLPLLAIVPLLSGLVRNEAKARQAVAFACASPFSNPTTLTFTALALGPHLAFARLMVAWAMGTLAGFLLWSRTRAAPPCYGPMASERELRGFTSMLFTELRTHVWHALPYFIVALLAASWTQVLIDPADLSALLGNDAARTLALLIGGGLLFPCGGMAIAYLGSGTLPLLTTGQSMLFLLSGSLLAWRNVISLWAILTWKGLAAFMGLAVSLLLFLSGLL